jgi:hypothetical protein
MSCQVVLFDPMTGSMGEIMRKVLFWPAQYLHKIGL